MSSIRTQITKENAEAYMQFMPKRELSEKAKAMLRKATDRQDLLRA